MLVKLGSTVVPAYLWRISACVVTKVEMGSAAYFKNSISDRFVNTILVESQSSMPICTRHEPAIAQIAETSSPRLMDQSFSLVMSTASDRVNLSRTWY